MIYFCKSIYCRNMTRINSWISKIAFCFPIYGALCSKDMVNIRLYQRFCSNIGAFRNSRNSHSFIKSKCLKILGRILKALRKRSARWELKLEIDRIKITETLTHPKRECKPKIDWTERTETSKSPSLPLLPCSRANVNFQTSYHVLIYSENTLPGGCRPAVIPFPPSTVPFPVALLQASSLCS